MGVWGGLGIEGAEGWSVVDGWWGLGGGRGEGERVPVWYLMNCGVCELVPSHRGKSVDKNAEDKAFLWRDGGRESEKLRERKKERKEGEEGQRLSEKWGIRAGRQWLNELWNGAIIATGDPGASSAMLTLAIRSLLPTGDAQAAHEGC